MKSLRGELGKAFAKSSWVTVCWDPDCRLHRLDHWPADRWVAHRRQEGYANYTHGICQTHTRSFERQVERFFAQREAPTAA